MATDDETEDAVMDEDTNEVLTAGVDEDKDIRNAGLEQAPADLDDLMQPMEDEVVFEEEEEPRRSL